MAEKVTIELTLEQRKVLTELNKLAKATRKTAEEAKSSFGKMSDAFSVFAGNLAANAASKALGAIKNAIGTATREMVDFQKAVAEVNSLLPKTSRLTENNVKALKDLSAEYGRSQTEQAKAFYQVISAGIQGTSKQLDLLRVSNEAAVAGLTSTTVAVDVLTTVVNSYASTNLKSVEASDALFAAVREGKTTFDELAGTIGRVAPLASSAGIAFSQVTGTLAALTKSGLSTDESVTGLRALFNAIIAPSTEAAKEAKKLGLQWDAAGLKAKGLAVFLKELQTVTGGNITTLSKLVPNVRALVPVLSLVNGDFEDFVRILEATKNSAGATAAAAEVLKGTLDFKLKVLDQEFKGLSTTLLELFIPAIQSSVSKLGDFAKAGKEAFSGDIFEGNNLVDFLAEVTNNLRFLNPQLSITNDVIKQFTTDAEDLTGVVNQLTTRLGAYTNAANRIKAGDLGSKEKAASLEILNKKIKETSDQIKILSGQFGSAQLTQIPFARDKSLDAFLDPTGTQVPLQPGLDGVADDSGGVENNPRVKTEITVNNKILELRALADAKLDEFRAAKGFSELELQDVKLSELESVLTKEQQIKFDFAKRNTDGIEDEQNRSLKLKELQAKKELQIATNLGKKLSENKKKTTEEELKIEATKFQVSSNLINALSELSALGGAKNFGVTKALALAAIPINTAAGIMNAIATIPGPAGIAQGAAVGILGAVQFAKVAASKAPSFETGGIIPGAPSSVDNQIANVASGEMVLTMGDQETLFNSIRDGNFGNSSQNIIVEIDGQAIATAVRNARLDGATI